MRSRWVSDEKIRAILVALTPPNRLAVEMSYRYGMRIGDVLATRTEDVRKGRWTYKEEKTGKRRRITLSPTMQTRLLQQAGRIYVFEHRLDQKRHRTRFAVYKDMRRVADFFRMGAGVSPHSARKGYAVREYHQSGNDLKRVQRLLNHGSEAVTMIYALADELCEKSNDSMPKKNNSRS